MSDVPQPVAESIDPTPNQPATITSNQTQDTQQPQAPAKHPEFVRNMAQNLAFTQEQINSVDTATLEQMLVVAHRTREHERAQNRQAQQQVPQPQPQAQADPEWSWGEVEEDDGAGKKVKRKVTDEDVVPGLLTVKEIPALKKELAELRQIIAHQQRQEQNKSRTQMLDEAFDALGPDFQSLVGKGGAAQFKPDDDGTQAPELEMRNMIFRMAGVPENHPEFSARLRKAAAKARAKFAPAQQTNGTHAPNRVAPYVNQQQVEEWNAGGLAASTNVNSPTAPQSEFDQYLAEVQAERRARGQEPDRVQKQGHAWLN